MAKEINHECCWHGDPYHELTEHEVVRVDPEAREALEKLEPPQKILIDEDGNTFWAGDGAPPGISWEDYAGAEIERNAGVAVVGTRGSFRPKEGE